MLNFRLTPASALLVPLLLIGCSDGADNPSSSAVDVRFSDAPVDNLTSVVVTVESIEMVRAGKSLNVQTFADEGNAADSVDTGVEPETFTIDLMQVTDNDSELVLDGVVLEVGRYEELRLNIVDGIDSTYVVKTGETEHTALKVPSGQLKLGGFDVDPTSTQTLMVEFGLRESMTYNPGPDRYILKPRGVRIVGLGSAANLRGTIDTAVLDDAACPSESFESVYLYTADRSDAMPLGDLFDSETLTTVDAIAPLAAARIGDDRNWFISYLPDGDYTLAYACSSTEDLPDTLESITIPAPSDLTTDLSLTAGTETACDLTLEGFDCSVTGAVPGPAEQTTETESADEQEEDLDATDSVEAPGAL